MLPPRAFIFIGLNAVRILSIVALILVFASSILVMVNDVTAVNNFMSEAQASGNTTQSLLENCDYIQNSTVPNQTAGVFWAVVNRLFIIFQVIMLVLSEVGWPIKFFDRFFPVLGSAFGLGPLGIFQGLIGATILSHHVDDFSLVSAFFAFSLGCVNILLGLIFGPSARLRRSLTEWRNENKGVLPSIGDNRPLFTRPTDSFVASVFNNEKGSSEFGVNRTGSDRSASGFGFGRQGEKAAGLRGFLISKPIETLPKYAPKPPSITPQARSSRGSSMYTESVGPEVPQFKSSPHAI